MYIAAEMISILLAVSAAMRAENCIGSTCTAKPASLPMAVTRSTMTPWMVLVLVSRKVNGMPVGVDPTLSTGWEPAGSGSASPASTAMEIHSLRRIMTAPPVAANSPHRRRGAEDALPGAARDAIRGAPAWRECVKIMRRRAFPRLGQSLAAIELARLLRYTGTASGGPRAGLFRARRAGVSAIRRGLQ